jgi:two-component system chemotaxis response regulator CheB
MLQSSILSAFAANQIIAFGASTGGTESLAKLFRLLPDNMPGIVVTQHIPPGFSKLYADRLDKELPFFEVKEAVNGDIIRPKTIHIAPGGSQLRVRRANGGFSVSVGEHVKVGGHCPAVDVLFESVAAAAGRQATGVILTGMGADGAKGLLAMRRAGAYTIGQDQASSIVYGMPMEAYKLGAVIKQASLTAIPTFLVNHVMGKH